MAGRLRVRASLAPGKQVALDQGEEMDSEFMGQGLVTVIVDLAGGPVCFCFHRPLVWEMG